VAFGIEVTEERLAIYARELCDLPQEQLRKGFGRATHELKFFPKIAEIRELAAGPSTDGRPGPEESWARMPKGDRMELDTVIWCEEEEIAYSAARPLLLEGDQIAARMCFLERYKRALMDSKGKPVKWVVSPGTDANDRLLRLAEGVRQSRISIPYATNFVPWDKAEEFRQMLPGAKTPALKGDVTKQLPGFAGLLQHMRIEGLDPELIPESRPEVQPLTPAELNKRKEALKQQAEELKKVRG
jgi:hypothetical protein